MEDVPDRVARLSPEQQAEVPLPGHVVEAVHIKNTTVGDLTIGGPQGAPRDIARNARLRQELTRMTMLASEQGAQLAV